MGFNIDGSKYKENNFLIIDFDILPELPFIYTDKSCKFSLAIRYYKYSSIKILGNLNTMHMLLFIPLINFIYHKNIKNLYYTVDKFQRYKLNGKNAISSKLVWKDIIELINNNKEL